MTVINGSSETSTHSTYTYGTELTVKATTKEGYTSKIYLDSNDITSEGRFTVSGAHKLTSEYVPNDYEVTFDSNLIVKKDGTTISSGTQVAYKTVLTAELKTDAVEKTGHKQRIYWNDTDITAEGKFTVGLNNSLSVGYVPIDYAVTFDGDLTVKKNGNPIASGDRVAYGTELTVEAAVSEGCTSKVFLNDKELTDGKFTVDLENVLTVKYTTIEYTVTIVVQGEGSVDQGVMKIPHGTAASVKGNVLTIGENIIVATPSDSNHTFTSWSGVPTTVTLDVTIAASFSQIFVDDKAEIETDTADIVAEKTGSTTTIVTEIKTDVADVDGAVKETLDKIVEVKKASGSPDSSVTVRVIVPVEKGTERLSISAQTATALKDSGAELTVTNGDTAVSLDAETIRTLEKASVDSGNPLSVEVTSDPANLSDSQKKVVGENMAVDVSAFIGSEKTSNLGGKATISIPYVTDKKVKVTYVKDNGRTEDIECTYANGVVSFVTTHFSVYMISEIKETVPVTPDTDDDYYPVVPTTPTGASYSDDDTKTLVACAAAAVAAALAAAFFIIDSRRR